MKKYEDIKTDFTNKIKQSLETTLEANFNKLASDIIDSYENFKDYNIFFEVYEKAIDANIAIREKMKFKECVIPPIVFAKEYMCHVDLGRRTNKTSFILKEASHNDLIVVKNYHMLKDIQYKTTAFVTTFDMLDDFKGINPKIIWFDDTADSEKEFKVLQTFIKRYDQLVIKLGK